jgi:hypothetical protein
LISSVRAISAILLRRRKKSLSFVTISRCAAWCISQRMYSVPMISTSAMLGSWRMSSSSASADAA